MAILVKTVKHLENLKLNFSELNSTVVLKVTEREVNLIIPHSNQRRFTSRNLKLDKLKSRNFRYYQRINHKIRKYIVKSRKILLNRKNRKTISYKRIRHLDID